MGKSIDSAIVSAFQGDSAQPIYFIELLIDTGSPETVLRLHTGLGTITTATSDDATSRAFTGAGSLLDIQGISETNKPNPAPFRATLSGVDSSVTNVIFNTNYYRRPCKVYLSALSAGALVADPQLIGSYFIQEIDSEFAGPNGDVVQMTAESEMILFKRSRNVRYTDRQLQSEYSGDLGLEFLEHVATSTVVWRGRNNRLGSDGSSGAAVRAVGRSIGVGNIL